MSSPAHLLSGTPPLPEDIVQILNSRTFEKAPALRQLLTYLWINRDCPASEYAIATEALGRSHSFDARTDATVRVQIGRLRRQLERFYQLEGKTSASRYSVPVGSHQIQKSVSAEPDIVPSAPLLSLSSPASGRTHFLKILIALLVLVCVVQTVLLIRRSAPEPSATVPPAPWFWQRFFTNGRAARIVLPTPVFFSLAGKKGAPAQSAIMLRETGVNDFAAGGSSATFRLLRHQLGAPTLAENYTVTSDTFAAVQLTRYLDALHLPAKVASSADAPLEALDTENVVAIGTWGTLAPLKPYLDRMNFVLGPHEMNVHLQNATPGEPAQVNETDESPNRQIWPGVIGFLPDTSHRTHLLLLAGRQTSALVSFLTSTNGLNHLEKLWREKGSPDYFEVVVNTELSGRGPVRFWPVALHAARAE